ncbi:sialoadhesin-like [Stegostoma tigrinum]|uniref:sialoadhesin-like n=1 Tax=Stegostoma tigrinum TaxID=3053191 RepID=UPI0028708B35|nr:sialoadhesin-like [Stegostoma tigrinum]
MSLCRWAYTPTPTPATEFFTKRVQLISFFLQFCQIKLEDSVTCQNYNLPQSLLKTICHSTCRSKGKTKTSLSQNEANEEAIRILDISISDRSLPSGMPAEKQQYGATDRDTYAGIPRENSVNKLDCPMEGEICTMNSSHWALALICLIQGYSSANEWGVSLPTTLNALEGTSVIFNCSFQYPGTRTSGINAMWLQFPCHENSDKLYMSNEQPPDSGIEFIGNLTQNNCSLRINAVQKKHSNTFCFRFVLPERNKWTGKPGLHLTVYARPKTPFISPSELVEGVTTKLNCSSSNIDEKAMIRLKWYGLPNQAAEQCNDNPRVVSSCLRFIPSYQDHNKIVKCSVTYSVFSYSDEANITLNVSYAPKNVTIQVDNGSELAIKEGDKVSLTCTSNSNPKATYSWYKREDEKGEARRIDASKGTLSFQTIASGDSGFYSCKAANHVGNNTSETLEIRVQYAPKNVTIQVVNGFQMDVKEGGKLSLLCTSNSNPEATYTWYKREESNGQTRSLSAVKGILTFQHVSRSDSGFYSCTATNYIGSGSSDDLEIYVQSSTILKFAIAGSLGGIGFLLAIVLWTRRKDLFKGKKPEINSQPDLQHEKPDTKQSNQTNNSTTNVIYDNTCMSESPGNEWETLRKNPANTLVYASVQFNNKYKDLDQENSHLRQVKPGSTQQSQATQSIDSAVYENVDKYKPSSEGTSIIREEPEDAVQYACVVFKDKLLDPKAAIH